jgi:CHAT domain-containing protein/tetratricopeptide (TPR) repeat protein
MKVFIAAFLGLVTCYGQDLSPEDRARMEQLNKQIVESYQAGKYADAVASAQAALRLAEKALGAEHLETATALSNLALLYVSKGQFEGAEPLYQRALRIYEKEMGPKHPDTATVLNNLAGLYISQRQYDKAEPLLVRALVITEEALGPEHASTAASLNNLAELYKSQGLYTKAEPLLARALAIFEKLLGPEHPSTATSLNNLAGLYESQGKYAQAEPLYQRALIIREKALGSEHPDTATALNSLALLYQFQGQYAKAEPLFRRVLAIREKTLGREHPATAISLNNLAGLYSDAQGQYEKAEPLYQRSLAIYEKVLGPDHPDMAAPLNNLARLYRSQGQYDKAMPLQQRALTIVEKARPEHPNTAKALGNLARLYEEQGQYDKAEPLYRRSLAIFEKASGPENVDTAMALNNLANVYRSQAQYSVAEPLYRRALSIHEKTLGVDHPESTNTRENLAILQWVAEDFMGARRTLMTGWTHKLQWMERSLRFGTDPARRNYVKGLKTQLSILIAMQGNDNRIHSLGLQALLVSKGRVLEETAVAMEALRRRAGQNLQPRLDELNSIRAQRGALVNASPTGQIEKLKSKIEVLNDKEDTLTAELMERSLEFRELAATPRIQELRGMLGPAALVEMVEFEETYIPERDGKRSGPARYGAYVLTAAGNVLWWDFGPAAAIDALVRRYRYAMSVRGNDAVAQGTARQLDALVFAPIRQALPQINDFYISADDLLRLIPFTALTDANSKPLIENYRIQTLSTGRDLLRKAPVHSVQAAWVGGLAEFGQPGEGLFFPAIPSAKEEAQEVAKIIRPKPQELNDGQLTKQFLMQQMNGPRILHLATHGYYSGQTGGLALKDANLGPVNILNREEAAGLRLQGTQLVVLSACETALGEVSFADGVIGLQRSLTLAGARSQILTLWPVNDAKTKDLMVAFYRNLFEKKMTKSEALRQAQLGMVYQGADPYYWAPFVLYGDGGPLGE